jgi:hypothetical protein
VASSARCAEAVSFSSTTIPTDSAATVYPGSANRSHWSRSERCGGANRNNASHCRTVFGTDEPTAIMSHQARRSADTDRDRLHELTKSAARANITIQRRNAKDAKKTIFLCGLRACQAVARLNRHRAQAGPFAFHGCAGLLGHAARASRACVLRFRSPRPSRAGTDSQLV